MVQEVSNIFYTVYKVTNLINGKFYIGKHQTTDLDDSYMGSGKLIKRAILKYGVNNFSKEYLGIYDTEQKMSLAERILVVIDPEVSYNLCAGGKGGFGYINENKLQVINVPNKVELFLKNVLPLSKISDKFINYYASGKHSETMKESYSNRRDNGETFGGWKNIKHHSEETKEKMRKPKNIGESNSQFGTCWVTNGTDNKKIKKEELNFYLNLGFSRGRTINR